MFFSFSKKDYLVISDLSQDELESLKEQGSDHADLDPVHAGEPDLGVDETIAAIRDFPEKTLSRDDGNSILKLKFISRLLTRS